MVLRNQTIDDRDTNTIHYQGDWFNQGTYNATSVGRSGTLSSANDPNANFTVDTPPIFAFYYFGIRVPNGGFYQICIDCDPNNRSWLDIDALNRTDDGKNPPVVLFSKQWTSPQSHEIIVTNRPDIRYPNGNSRITLDTLVYTIDDGNPAPIETSTTTSTMSTTISTTRTTTFTTSIATSTTSTTTFTTSTTSSISGITSSTSSTASFTSGTMSFTSSTTNFTSIIVESASSTMSTNASPSSLSSQPLAHSGSVNNGTLAIVILFSVIGGVLLFLLGVFVMLRCQRRRASTERASTEPSPFRSPMVEASNPAINFIPSFRENEENSFVIRHSTKRGSGLGRVPIHASSTTTPVSQGAGPSGSAIRRVPTHTSSTTTLVPQDTGSSGSANRREEDAGSINSMRSYGGTLPPDYNNATRNRQLSYQETW